MIVVLQEACGTAVSLAEDHTTLTPSAHVAFSGPFILMNEFVHINRMMEKYELCIETPIDYFSIGKNAVILVGIFRITLTHILQTEVAMTPH